jgi:hypothetical protein
MDFNQFLTAVNMVICNSAAATSGRNHTPHQTQSADFTLMILPYHGLTEIQWNLGHPHIHSFFG